MDIPALDQSMSFVEKDNMVNRQIQSMDWSATSIGDRQLWPASLVAALDTLTASDYPMFLVWGSDHIFFYNDAAALLFAPLQPAVHLYTQAKDAWPAMWQRLQPVIDEILQGSSTPLLQDVPIPIYRHNEVEEAYWHFGFSRIKETGGTIAGVLITCMETTARVRLQKEAVNTKEQLQEALEACDLGTWDLDPVTMAFNCNQKTKEIFGLPANRYVDLQVAVDMIETADRPKIKEAIDKALHISSGGRYEVSYTVYPPNGTKKIVKAKGKVTFDATGQPVRFTGTLQDVTIEETIRRQQEKLQQLVEGNKDYMSMATLDGQMTYINAAGRTLVGLAPDADISRLHLRDFYSAEQFDFVKCEIIPALEKERYWAGVVNIKHQQTGEEIPCYGNYLLVHDPVTGKVISRALTLRDLRPELTSRKELEDSEKRFRNLVQQAPVATAIYTGPEMRIQWANDAMIKLWGKDTSVVGKTIREALPELEGQPFHQLLERVYTTGEMYLATEDRGDLVVDGELQTFYFNFSYKPLRDTEGKVYGILNMAIDVTEQIKMQRRLEESERNFRSLIMQAPIGICLISGDDFILEVANDHYLELAGRTRAEAVNRPIWEVLPEAKAQGFDKLLSGVKESGKAYVGVGQPITLIRNGRKENLFINFVYEPLFDESGKAHSVLVVAIDITQQVKARQAVEEAEERARLAVESAKLGAYDLNLLTGEVIPSDRFIEIFDVDVTSGHQDYISRVHSDDLPKRKIAHEQALQTGKLEYECRVIRRDETIAWVKIYGQYYFNEQGQPHKIIGIVQDITQQKAGEEELERRVQERTAELVKLNQELQHFTYVSSHDLKEPLRKIQVFADMAQREIGATNARLVKHLDKVKQSANRMSSLLNDLLNYSLLSNTENQFASIDLNTVILHVEEDLELMIQEKGAGIHKSSLPVIEGIPFQIKQLFYNVINNALKFSRPDVAPYVIINATELSDEEKQDLKLSTEEQYYRIDIKDNGIGFDPKSAEKIFVVFQRLNSRELYSGNGIGLSICKKIAENHQGKIMASSTPDQGSTFTLILPQRQHK